MHKFEVQLINEAFSRCYGLAGFILNEKQNGIDILSHQTGIRSDYLKRHSDEVINLSNEFEDYASKK